MNIVLLENLGNLILFRYKRALPPHLCSNLILNIRMKYADYANCDRLTHFDAYISGSYFYVSLCNFKHRSAYEK